MTARRPLGAAGNVAACFAPVIILAELVALGANGFVPGVAACVAAFVTMAIMVVVIPPQPAFWSRLRPVMVPFALALLWAAVPLLAPGLVGGATRFASGTLWASLVTLVGILLWLPIGAMMGFVPRVSKRAIDVLLLLAIPWIVLSIVAYKFDPGRVWGIEQGLVRPRYSATLLNPNTAGCAMAMLSVLAAARFTFAAQAAVETVGKAQKRAVIALIASWLIMILALTAAALTGSRMAVLLAGFGVAAIALQARQLARFRASYFIACVAALLLPLLAGALVGGIRLAQKMGAIDGDAAIRWQDLEQYWHVSLHAPWFGHGLGSFRAVNLATLDPDHALHRWSFGAAHNVLLHGAIEGGWPFALLATGGIAVGAILVARARRGNSFDSLMYGKVFAVAIALFGGLGDIALNVPAFAAFATWLGGLAVGRAIRASSAMAGPHRDSPASAHRR